MAIAGPTCDEVDILYEKSNYELPLTLEIGDKVEILSAGAYTASCSSVGFKRFPAAQGILHLGRPPPVWGPAQLPSFFSARACSTRACIDS